MVRSLGNQDHPKGQSPVLQAFSLLEETHYPLRDSIATQCTSDGDPKVFFEEERSRCKGLRHRLPSLKLHFHFDIIKV